MSKAAKINGQQIPKVEAVMDKFVAPPGYVLMDTDFASLEPKVVAYFSRDPQHLQLYGPESESRTLQLDELLVHLNKEKISYQIIDNELIIHG